VILYHTTTFGTTEQNSRSVARAESARHRLSAWLAEHQGTAGLVLTGPAAVAWATGGIAPPVDRTAGVDLVWAGHCEPWKNPPGWPAIAELPKTTLVPLDVTDTKSVNELAAELGFKVDIVINTAEHHRTFGLVGRAGVETARAEMETNCFGLLRLAQAFGPVMQARGADGDASAVAWVNLFSIFALANYPPHGTYSASKAAAFSLSQALRAELRPAGVRVINVFPGPIDDEWNQTLPPPKLTPDALAKAVVNALEGGVEDIYPGDVAQEWLARWEENPKVLEREISIC